MSEDIFSTPLSIIDSSNLKKKKGNWENYYNPEMLSMNNGSCTRKATWCLQHSNTICVLEMKKENERNTYYKYSN